MNIKAEAIAESFLEALKYLPQTLKLVLIPLAIGIIIGTLVALVRVYKVPVLSQFFAVFIPIYQGIPIVVALMIYNLVYLMKCDDILRFFHSSKTIADTDTIGIGIFALSMMMTCSISEVIRGSLLSIDKGQSEAAYVVGLTKVQTIRRIILPQIIPVAIPPLVNNTVGLIKATSIVYTIGIAEVLSGALVPASKRYTFFEGYLAAALVYWILTIIVELLFKLAEKKAGKFRG
jgi:L-cystine transport system permease protein